MLVTDDDIIHAIEHYNIAHPQTSVRFSGTWDTADLTAGPYRISDFNTTAGSSFQFNTDTSTAGTAIYRMTIG